MLVKIPLTKDGRQRKGPRVIDMDALNRAQTITEYYEIKARNANQRILTKIEMRALRNLEKSQVMPSSSRYSVQLG